MAELEYIPQGYKKSPLGIIPLEWDVVHLGSLVSITSGESPSSYCLKNFGKYPYVKVEDMNNCEKYQKNSREYSDDERNIVSINSVIFPKRGAAISNNKVRIAACNLQMDSNMMAITPNANTICEFLYYMIKFKQLYRIADTSTIPQINNKHIIPYKICLPPIEEQKKIAELLSEWDKAIELQTKLIEKLELRKRALMQHLLTGRIRLSGFSDKWKKKRLSEIGAFLSSNTLAREKLNKIGGHIQNIHYGDILIHYPTIVNPEYSQIPYVNKDVIVTSDLLQDGDIVFADTAEDNTVGKAIEIVNAKSRQIVAGLHTIPFRPNNGLFAKQFLGYYINSASYQKQLRALTQGIKVCSISKSSIKNTYLQIPSLAEQITIAEVLMSADAEIEIAKTKLSSLRNQKRGLMQQLLTGKKRV